MLFIISDIIVEATPIVLTRLAGHPGGKAVRATQGSSLGKSMKVNLEPSLDHVSLKIQGCVDINECCLGSGAQCSETCEERCENTLGSFTCSACPSSSGELTKMRGLY